MGFFSKIGEWFRLFMRSRYGADQLSVGLFYVALVLVLLGMIPALNSVTNLLALLAMAYSVFRMLSTNRAARARENEWLMKKISPALTGGKQALVRYQNRKVYRYPVCPKCKARLRIPRSVGAATLTCGRCGNKFDVKGK